MYLKDNQLVININGVIFNIKGNELNNVENYFHEFILPCNDPIINNYIIEFVNSDEIFNEYYKKIDLNNSIEYDTFNNQKHYQYQNYFLIDSNDYICIKYDDYNYKLVTKQSKTSCKYLIRVMRELLVREMEDNNYFYMHGVGLKIFNKGILLLGNSGSGKTTFLSRLNSTDEKQLLVSNDRVFINSSEMKYFPLNIVYSMGTVRKNTNLNEAFINNRYLENRRNGNYEEATKQTKCDVPLTEISKIFKNVGNISKSNIDLVIFPRMVNDSELKVNEISNISDRLNDCNFTPNDVESNRKEWLRFRKTKLEDIEIQKEIMNHGLIDNTKVLEIQYPKCVDNQKLLKLIGDLL